MIGFASGMALMLQGGAPVVIQPFASTDPAYAAAVWEAIEAQDAPKFSAMLADGAEFSIDREPVEGAVTSFATLAAECDLFKKFVFASNVLGSISPFEAVLTCKGPDGQQKRAGIYLDNKNKVIAIQVFEPIVFKF